MLHAATVRAISRQAGVSHRIRLDAVPHSLHSMPDQSMSTPPPLSLSVENLPLLILLFVLIHADVCLLVHVLGECASNKSQPCFGAGSVRVMTNYAPTDESENKADGWTGGRTAERNATTASLEAWMQIGCLEACWKMLEKCSGKMQQKKETVEAEMKNGE